MYSIYNLIDIGSTLKIKNTQLLGTSIAYFSLPVFIFFIGYLNLFFAIASSFLYLCALIIFFKKICIEKIYDINICGLVILAILSAIWVWISGVGGYWFQMPDWLWRNALFRDLIDFSWPVEYPNGNRLAYYFGYFLPSALLGKIFGWSAANLSLCVFTWIGVFLTLVWVAIYIQINKTISFFLLAIIFIIYGGLEEIRAPIANLLLITNNLGYQFSPNTTLLEWVTNQTVFPWLCTAIFLNFKRIESLGVLGMTMLAVAPLPFCGFCFLSVIYFIFCLLDKTKSLKDTLKSAFCLPNLLSILVILPIFFFFYTENDAANGNYNGGGFGLYVPENFISNLRWQANFLSFLFFNAFIFIILIYRRFRKNIFYYIVILSLLILPLFKIGTGWDFQMRATIPALFLLCIFLIEFVLKESFSNNRLSFVLIIGFMFIRGLSFYNETIMRYTWGVDSQNKSQNGIYSFAGKISDNAFYSGGELMNFLVKKRNSFFFDSICKSKSEKDINNDKKTQEKILNELGFPFESGIYSISPFNNKKLSISNKSNKLFLDSKRYHLILSTSTQFGFYEIYTKKSGGQFSVLNQDREDLSFINAPGSQSWGQSEIPSKQIFKFIKSDSGDSFFITTPSNLALTYQNGGVVMRLFSGSDVQKWVVEH